MKRKTIKIRKQKYLEYYRQSREKHGGNAQVYP